MIVINKIAALVCIILCLWLLPLMATDFTYDVDVDTALYKVKVFQSAITGTADELFGIVLNTYPSAYYKVATIDFGITNGSSSTTYDLIIDSIYIRTYQNNDEGIRLFGQADMLRFTGVTISQKECASFRAYIDYPHTGNITSTYKVRIRIFGSYE